MKIGIIGLPQTGKKQLFTLLTGTYHTLEKGVELKKPIIGIAEIKDIRFENLLKLYSPKKHTRAKIEIVLFPAIEKEFTVLDEIGDIDAICYIVRGFKDDSVYHLYGSIDPKRDINIINSELILHDLIFIEKRLERIENNIKRLNDESSRKEKGVLLHMRDHLTQELPLRVLELTDEEKKIVASYPFITLKEMILVLNVSETDLKDESLIQNLKEIYNPLKIGIMQVSVNVELEIASLETEEEREEFLREAGIKESALNLFTAYCIKALGLISFFTVAHTEVRQWFVRSGSSVCVAAGVIHTDLQKGFIRAEVIKYNDLIELRDEEKIKKCGKCYLKGKDYIVEDGDILSIRFNI